MESSDASKKPVFVLVTAKTCPHCHHFRNNWDNIRGNIETSGLARVVDIEVNTTSDRPDTRRYPRDLHRFVNWYPTFLLIRGRTWDNGLPVLGQEAPDTVLDGVIYNGHLTPTRAEFIKGLPPTAENLIAWVRAYAPKLCDSAVAGMNPILNMLSAGTSDTGGQTSVVPSVSGALLPATGSGTGQKANVCRMKLRPRNS